MLVLFICCCCCFFLCLLDLAFFAFATQSVIVTHSFCIHSFARFVLFVFLYFVCLFLFFFFTFIVFVLVFYFVRSFTSTLLSRFALVLLARSCRFAPVFVSAVCACACACVCHACTPGRLFCLFFLMFVYFFYFLFFNESADFAFVLLARLWCFTPVWAPFAYVRMRACVCHACAPDRVFRLCFCRSFCFLFLFFYFWFFF